MTSLLMGRKTQTYKKKGPIFFLDFSLRLFVYEKNIGPCAMRWVLEAMFGSLIVAQRDQSGVLEYEELKKMWIEIRTWQVS